jgi:hypothetical protein
LGDLQRLQAVYRFQFQLFYVDPGYSGSGGLTY